MKKYFLFAMIACLGIVLVSCENGSGQGKNPYPYLRLSDLAPIPLAPLSKADVKLAELGFNKYGKVTEGGHSYYLYFSNDKLDTIYCSINTDELVNNITYYSAKQVLPSEASGWLAHIPETVNLPNYAESFQFTGAWFGKDDTYSYSEYLNEIKDGVEDISAEWSTTTNDNNSIYIYYYTYDGAYGAYIIINFAD